MTDKRQTRILIVDDSRVDRRILKQRLVSAGYAVEEAKNGKDALGMALADPPDMIISDALMPVMDGFRLCRAIRADRRTCHLPFVLYTGTYTLAEDQAFAARIGADRFVVKTGDGNLLLEEIRAVLAEKQNKPSMPFSRSPEAERETEKIYNERLIRKLGDKVRELKKEIARRKKMEKQFADSRESLDLALEGAGLGMWDWDLKTDTARLQHEWLGDFFDPTDEKLTDMEVWTRLIHPEDRDSALAALQANLDGTTAYYECDYRMKDKSGNWHWIFAKGRVASRDGAGHPRRHVGIFSDISGRKEMEINVSKSEEKYRTILESIEDGYFEVDLAGNLVFFNKILVRILGYPPSELQGLNYRSYMDLENAAKTYETFHQVFKTGTPLKGYEWKIMRPNGEGRYLDTSISPIKDADGKVTGFRGITRDVTDRRLMEKFLAETEERYRLIFENAPVGILHYDQEGIIRACNQAYVDINGSTYGKLIGFNILQRVTNQMMLAAVKKSLAGEPGHYEGEYVSVTGGRQTYLKVDFVPVFSKENSLSGGMGVVEDISERKMAEDALRDSEEKYRGLAERSPGMIFMGTGDGVCQYASSSVERILGYRPDEIIGRGLGDFFAPKEANKILKAIIQCMDGGTVPIFETEVSKKDGSMAVLEWELTPVAADGRITSVQSMVRDITDRKRIAEALEASRRDLQALSKHLQSSREQERAAIAREIHDDLGQTLTALKMDGSWLLSKIPEHRPELSLKTREAISLIDSAIKTVKRIILDLRPGLLDDLGLSAAIEWQAGEYRRRSGINICVAIEPEDIFLDEDLSIAVFRVCQESLTNVIRHSGAVEVRVRLTKNNRDLVLEVADNGRGITEEELAQKDAFGLIGMRERIHSFGGTIKIFRNGEGGTTVAVQVPLRESETKPGA